MKPWHAEVGRRPFVVHVEERPGRKNLWLRWWNVARDNWEREPTEVYPRDPDGRWVRAAESQGIAAAEAKHRALSQSSPILIGDHLTLLDGLREALDPDRGLYPTDTPHRKEVERAVTFAAQILSGKPWVGVTAQDIQQVWRAKIRELRQSGLTGHRQAEIVTTRLLTVARWLAANKRIPPGACTPPHQWRKLLRSDWRQLTGTPRDPEPSRPRHTPAQILAVLRAAGEVDPRLHLLLWLGLELRHGQVARARRSDLDLEAGTFRVHGIGHKKGTTVTLTAGQIAAARAALTAGYRAPLERVGGDFPLFPGGQLRGGRKGAPRCLSHHRSAKPVTSTALRKWFTEAQELAGVERLPGRGLYGFRRGSTDQAVIGLDEEALKRFGGWTDSQMPRQVYKDKQDKAADDRAARVRAEIRGETIPETVSSKTEGVSVEVGTVELVEG